MSLKIYIIICTLIFIILFRKKVNNSIICIAIISCNRYIYLNKTLPALEFHLRKYERNISVNKILYDQGTAERNIVKKNFDIYNSFFMNPSGYEKSFSLIFSYLYTKYIFLLEEDWMIVDNLVKETFYPSFVGESIKILEKVEEVYGILLRESTDLKINYSVIVKTTMGSHYLNVAENSNFQFSYTNGATIYRCSDLNKLKYYVDEFSTHTFFKNNSLKLAFTYKLLKYNKYDSKCQSVIKHIGKRSTGLGICNKWLY